MWRWRLCQWLSAALKVINALGHLRAYAIASSSCNFTPQYALVPRIDPVHLTIDSRRRRPSGVSLRKASLRALMSSGSGLSCSLTLAEEGASGTDLTSH